MSEILTSAERIRIREQARGKAAFRIEIDGWELIDRVLDSWNYQRRVTDRMRANSPLALSAALNLAAGNLEAER